MAIFINDPTKIEIKRIESEDLSDLSSVLVDTVTWLNQEMISQWPLESLSPEKLLEAYAGDEIHIGYLDDRPVCSVVIQQKDNVFWQGSNHDDALYLHKLAVVSEYRGTGLAETLVDLVCQRALALGNYHVRLDCRTNRDKLCQFYIKQAFQHQGNIMVSSSAHSLYQNNTLIQNWLQGIF